MKRAIVIATAALLIGASPAPKSAVTFRVPRAGCLLLKPGLPIRLWVTPGGRESGKKALLDRTISPRQTVRLLLEPGFYEVRISTPRCWPSRQTFVVGTHWHRDVFVKPGHALKPLSKDVYEFVDVLYGPASGLVLHTSPSVSRVTVLTESFSERLPAKHSGDVWYFDYAGVGRAKLTFFVGSRVARIVELTLHHNGFVERIYRTP